jgi:predicted MFS family arabinose efflux permease
MAGPRLLIRNRDFTTLWVGESVSELGSRMSLFVFPLLAFGLSGSALLAALAEGSYLAGLVSTLLPAGVLVDRFDRRRLMVLASGTGGVLYASLAVAGALGHLTVGHLLAVGLLSGAAAGVFTPAQASAVRSIVSTEELPTALSQDQGRRHVAELLGGPLGGVLYSLARWAPFAVDALTFAVSCLTVRRIRSDLSPVPTAGPRSRPLADAREGLRYVAGRPLFRVLLSWSALVNLVVNALLFVVVLRMLQAGAHPGEIGLVSTAAGIGGILGALAAPTLIARVPTGRLTVLIAWTTVAPVLPLVVWAQPTATAAALFVILLLNPAGNAGIGAYRMAVTPPALQGRVAATSSFLTMSVLPVAPLLGGLLLQLLGGPVATLALAVASAGTALVVTCSASVRSVPRPASWPRPDAAAAG